MGKEKRPENKDANKSLNRKCTNNKFKGSRTVLAHLSSSKKLVIRSDNSCSNECKDGGKMMKDHSMETDFCILRRYCKMKNLKINKKKVFKTQSNYEVNKETVSGSSEKSKTDNSACGDSRRTTPFIINNVEEFNANFAALVINNLNKLLRNWIKNYLFNNDDTKKKIQIILDSMLKKLEAKNDYVSTSSTYTIDIRIRESNTTPLNVETISTTSQSFETKSHSLPENIPKCKAFSSFTVPNPDNNSLISTLSIPKYVHACHHQMTGKNLCYSLSKTKRLYNKNVLLTISKSNGILSDSSSLNFLDISTKSLTKPFATYRDKNMVKRNLKKRRIIFIPSSYCKFPGTTSITHINGEILKRDRLQKEHDTNPPLDAMPSLVKSIFTDDLSNMDSTDECSSLEKKDINTMTEEFIMRKRDEKMKELCENSTNMTPHLTINAAAGNDSVSIVFPRIAPNVSLKRLTLSCENYVSKENVPQCTCKNSKVIKSFSCKACLKATDSKNDSDPPLLTIDFLNKKCNNCCKRQGSNKQELGAKKSAIIHKINSLKKLFAKKQKKCCEVNSKNQSQIDFEKIRHKRFCYKHKKSNNQLHKNDFLNHFQDVFNYFANYKGKRNINLDICINVYPTIETTKRNETICKQICSTYDVRTSESEIVAKDLITNDSDSKLDDPNMKVTHICNCEQKLIPLFDDTINKKKSENINICSNTSRNIQESTLNISNKITTTAELEIAQEVFQLRTIIKDLAVTAEKFVTEHLKNTQLQTDNIKSATEQNIILNNFAECIQSAPNDTTGNNILENVKRSKSTQLTNNISCQKLSGIKTKKDPQNKTAVDIQARLMKKSTSYNIIDSETILKVTDMTSATQTCTFNSVTDEGLTCSLPKCKSLYDISVDSNKNKLMAFYCEELLRKPESENISISAPPIVSSPEPGKHPVKKKSSAKVTPKEKSRTSKHEVDCAECLPVSNNKCANNNISCSSVFINVDDRTNEKKIKIRARRGIGFREGSLCCLILWIPVIVILWLLYIFIIKDKFKPKTFSLDKLSRSLDYGKNGSHLSITLSDLGF